MIRKEEIPTFRGAETFSTRSDDYTYMDGSFQEAELEDVVYTGPSCLVYNPIVATLDENTQFEPGLYSGEANQMRVSNDTPDGRTAIQFIQFSRVINDHVDKAKIVGSLHISDRDLRMLSNMLIDRIRQIDQSL